MGTVAQTTGGLGFHFTGLKDMYMGGRLNYADRIAVRFSPEDLLEGFITPDVIKDQFDDYSVVSVYAGRYIDFGDDLDGRISVSVQNLLNTDYVAYASYFFNETLRSWQYPRTFTISLMLEF